MRPAQIPNQTPYVVADEKAMGLLEVELQTDTSKDIHRFQIISVIRGDKQASYVTDLGSRLLFPNPPLNIISYMEHSVAELMDMADEARARSSVTKRLAELSEESAKGRNIIDAFLDRKDRAWKAIRNQSHFGPTFTKQRIGFNGRPK